MTNEDSAALPLPATRPVLRGATWGVLGAVTAAVLGIGGYKLLFTPPRSTLPQLYQTPDFTLMERAGRPFESRELRGKSWIADFIFTSCAGPCPRMTQAFADLIARLPMNDRLVFVTITVDPARDTPPVLASYAKAYNADPARWFFLTGEEASVRELIVRGFRMTVMPNMPNDREAPLDPHQILHSNYFLLVDAAGVVRGTYDGLDPERIRHLETDTLSLMKAGGL